MDILTPQINDYLDSLLPERDAIVQEMEAEAEALDFPNVGPQVGQLLEFLARSIGARTVFELGSGFGYSAVWFARGLAEDGKVILTDHSEENRKKAVSYFTRMNMADRIEFRVGDALALFREESGPFDIVFNDIDKKDYPDTIEPAFERLRSGGLFITDNSLWHGKVVNQSPDAATSAVLEFNRRLAAHDGFDTVFLPVRDGVAVARKQ